MSDEDRGRGKYAGREPERDRMTPEEEAEFYANPANLQPQGPAHFRANFVAPLAWLSLPETDAVIDALEGQATALAEAMKRTTTIPPRVRAKYATTLSLLTAALEYRSNYFAGIEPRERADGAWSAVVAAHARPDRRLRVEARNLAYLATDLLDYSEEELARFQGRLEDAIAIVALILAEVDGD